MAAKNSVKTYVEESFYHLYNRGVEKRDIFLNAQDFQVFLSYLKTYLLPKDEPSLHAILSSKETSASEKNKALKLLSLKNFSGDINLVAYALLPNHFHLLIKQEKADAIDRFINALGTRYTIYFNKKYRRVGPLYQGVYKAVLVNTDEQLLHLSRYIHLNPHLRLNLPVEKWRETPWPYSLPDYLEARSTSWLKPKLVLSYFNRTSKNNSYVKFVDDNIDIEPISSLLVDGDEAE